MPDPARPHRSAGSPGGRDVRSDATTRVSTEEAEFRRQVSARLRGQRAWLGRTQEEVAASAGVNRGFISAVERGTQRLDAWRLRLVAEALGTTLDRLLDDGPDRNSRPDH